MKLFNNIANKPFELDDSVNIQLRQSRQVAISNSLREQPPSHVPDLLSFDVVEDEMEEHESVYGDSQDGGADFENVDVQAILFYGYTGRRSFPNVEAL